MFENQTITEQERILKLFLIKFKQNSAYNEYINVDIDAIKIIGLQNVYFLIQWN